MENFPRVIRCTSFVSDNGRGILLLLYVAFVYNPWYIQLITCFVRALESKATQGRVNNSYALVTQVFLAVYG